MLSQKSFVTSPHQLSHTCCYFCNPAFSFVVLCHALTSSQKVQVTALTQDHMHGEGVSDLLPRVNLRRALQNGRHT